jgi:ATP-dependent Lhr-like helicase
MGAVDLVIQVESPKSVARGLQRIGRAGHGVGATAKGGIFPKFRGDLLECASSCGDARGPDRADGGAAQRARRARPADRRDRGLRPPQDSEGRVAVDELFALVTRTYSYSELSRDLLENVLDMLDGRYPSSEFGELRPRIVWDRIAGTIRPRKGAQKLAVVNAGTIPDRGLYAVTCPTAAASASSTRRWSMRRARGRRSCSARRRGGSRRSAATA